MAEIVLVPLADGFMQVGVFVAILVAPFGWARHRWGARLDAAILRFRRFGPVAGALLGVLPGCGGAVVVMPLYARGTVSFGTVVAALVATMGDSSFVILAAEPALALQLHGLLLLAGTVTGLAVDAARIRPPRTSARPAPTPNRTGSPFSAAPSPPRTDEPVDSPLTQAGNHWILSAGAPLTGVPGLRVTGVLRHLGPHVVAFWVLVALGVTVGVPVVFHAVDPMVLSRALGGIDMYLIVGVAGGVAALVVFAASHGRLAESCPSHEEGSLADVLRQGARETSFVTVWVMLAFVGWEILSATTGFDGSQLPLFGLAGVIVGALVGLIPGCGVQIMFCGLFLAGGMPVSSLVANAVSQDGDALLPLLALECRSALVASLVTMVPAVLCGTVLLLA